MVTEFGTFTLKETLFSGDDLTQVINTLMNLLLHAASLKESKVPSDVKGDDSVTVHKSRAQADAFLLEKRDSGTKLATVCARHLFLC